MKKKKKIYKDYSKITNATKGSKNIILVAGAIILVALLYYMLSPYQQCVRGYVSTNKWKSTERIKKSDFYTYRTLSDIKGKARVICHRN